MSIVCVCLCEKLLNLMCEETGHIPLCKTSLTFFHFLYSMRAPFHSHRTSLLVFNPNSAHPLPHQLTSHMHIYFFSNLPSQFLSPLPMVFCLLLAFRLSSQQHLILWVVCPTYFPALRWQTVGGLLKVVGESLDSLHQGYPGGRLIGKVIYCPVSVLHSSFSTSLPALLRICLSIHSFVFKSIPAAWR